MKKSSQLLTKEIKSLRARAHEMEEIYAEKDRQTREEIAEVRAEADRRGRGSRGP